MFEVFGSRLDDPPTIKPRNYAGPDVALQYYYEFVQEFLTMSDPLKPVTAGLEAGLRGLARDAAAAGELAAFVRQSLPEPLRPHVVSAARRGDDIVVIVDSAAWAARVRYAGPRVRETLEARGERLAGKLRVRVGRPVGRAP